MEALLARIRDALEEGPVEGAAPGSPPALSAESESALEAFLEGRAPVLAAAALADGGLWLRQEAAAALPEGALRVALLTGRGPGGSGGVQSLIVISGPFAPESPRDAPASGPPVGWVFRGVQRELEALSRPSGAARRFFDVPIVSLESPIVGDPLSQERLRSGLRRLQSGLSRLLQLNQFAYEGREHEVDEAALFSCALRALEEQQTALAAGPPLEPLLAELAASGQSSASEYLAEYARQLPQQAEEMRRYLACLATLGWPDADCSLPRLLEWLKETEASIRRFSSGLAIARSPFLHAQLLELLTERLAQQWSEARGRPLEELHSAVVLPLPLPPSAQFFHGYHQIANVTLLWKALPVVQSEYKRLQIRLNSIEDCVQSLFLVRRRWPDARAELEASVAALLQQDVRSVEFDASEQSVHDLQVDLGRRYLESRLPEFSASGESFHDLLRRFVEQKEILQHPFLGRDARSVLATPLRALCSLFAGRQEEMVRFYRSSYQGTTLDLLNSLHGLSSGNGTVLWKEQLQHQMVSIDRELGWILGSEWSALSDFQPFHRLLEKIRRLNFLDERSQQQLTPVFRAGDPMLVLRRGGDGPLSCFSLEANLPASESFVGNDAEVIKYYYRRNLGKVLPLPAPPLGYSPLVFSVRALLAWLPRGAVSLSELEVPLVRSEYAAVQAVAREIYERAVPWSSQTHVQRLHEALQRFRQALMRASEWSREVSDDYLHALRVCDYESTQFESILRGLASLVLERVTAEVPEEDRTRFLSAVNGRVSAILRERLLGTLERWVSESERLPASEEEGAASALAPLRFQLALREDKRVDVAPSLESAREQLYGRFHECISVVSAQARVEPTLFGRQSTFRDLVQEIPGALAARVVRLVERTVRSLREFVSEWNRFEALWRLNVGDLVAPLQEDPARWLAFLEELERSELVLGDGERDLGLAVVSSREVHGCVVAQVAEVKSEIYHRFSPVLRCFAESLMEAMASRRRVFEETLRLVTFSLEHFVANARFHEGLRENLDCWRGQVDLVAQCERLMSRHRRSDLTPALRGALASMVEAEAVLSGVLPAQEPQVRARFAAEREEYLAGLRRLGALRASGLASLPFARSTEALEALDSMAVEAEQLAPARSALTAAAALLSLSFEEPTEASLDSLRGWISELQAGWRTVSPLAERLQALRRTRWASFDAEATAALLSDLARALTPLQARFGAALSAVGELAASVQRAQDSLRCLVLLQSPVLLERHWSLVLAPLGLGPSPAALSLGQLLDAPLSLASLQPVVQQAQGEAGIEGFMRKSQDSWSGFRLSLDSSQASLGSSVIADFDGALDDLQQDLLTISSLRSSPHFAPFREEVEAWEGRLSRVRDVLSDWKDVQQRWVSLHRVFGRSRDIQTKLSQEFSMFKGVHGQLQSLYSLLREQPLLLKFVSVHSHIDEILQSVASDLSSTQKRLSIYLEGQRAAFPRFFFVGDEELVDLLGSLDRLGSHLGKMFVGVHSLRLDGARATHFCSREGEALALDAPLDLDGGRPTSESLRALEQAVGRTLQSLYPAVLRSLPSSDADRGTLLAAWEAWVRGSPLQLIQLSVQLLFASGVEAELRSGRLPDALPARVQESIALMVALLSGADESFQRFKCEQLIIEFVSERDVVSELLRRDVSHSSSSSSSSSPLSPECPEWWTKLKYAYEAPTSPEGAGGRLSVSVLSVSFDYGWEYLGLFPRLVQTPLTDRCYLALSHALSQGLGGNPFGPAGTGKTESVKSLARQFGRFVAVFNLNEGYEMASLSRILQGVCSIGGWCCLDEINRLSSGVLSALSQQVLLVLQAVRAGSGEVCFGGRPVPVHASVGLFVTMNPDYRGRSPLPENLRQLFRSFAMIEPDFIKIAEVLFYISGFARAESLAAAVVALFEHSSQYLTSQSHYDFTLRCLKAVIALASRLRRGSPTSGDAAEFSVVREAVLGVLWPKMVSQDVALFRSLVSSAFGAPLQSSEKALTSASTDCPAWSRKIDEFVTLLGVSQGVILAGRSGTGKSSVWRAALERLRGESGHLPAFTVINPKALSLGELYGCMVDGGSEWRDGILSALVRRASASEPSSSSSPPHLIVFDGEIDSRWAENLNSVLDNNQILTLPSGEHFSTRGFKLVFEVGEVSRVTMATISRCGLLWFNEEILPSGAVWQAFVRRLRAASVSARQRALADAFAAAWEALIEPAFAWALRADRCLLPSATTYHLQRRLETLVSAAHARLADDEAPVATDFASAWLLYAVHWACAGLLRPAARPGLLEALRGLTRSPEATARLADSVIALPGFAWEALIVADADEETEMAMPSSPSEERVWSVSAEEPASSSEREGPSATVEEEQCLRLLPLVLPLQPVVLLGPPGCGKTSLMRRFCQRDGRHQLVTLVCSQSTTPADAVCLLEHFGEYETVLSQRVLRPRAPQRDLVLFLSGLESCPSHGGARPMLSFLRGLAEQGGFWNPRTHRWIGLARVRLAASVNLRDAPESRGMLASSGSEDSALPDRLLSHCFLLGVAHPSRDELLRQTECLLRSLPLRAGVRRAVADAMVTLYLFNRERFESSALCVYSPRMLSDWARLVASVSSRLRAVPDEAEREASFVRLVLAAGLEIFSERLSLESDAEACAHFARSLFAQAFPGVSALEMHPLGELVAPSSASVLSSSTLDELAALFCSEVSPTPLELFEDSRRTVAQVQLVLQSRPAGVCFLLGESGSGKRLLSRFACWLEGVTVFQVRLSDSYSLSSLDEDLRSLVRRAAVQRERVCFLLGEALLLRAGGAGGVFLERLHSLLDSEDFCTLFDAPALQALLGDFQQSLGTGSDAAGARALLRSTVARNLTVLCPLSIDRGGAAFLLGLPAALLAHSWVLHARPWSPEGRRWLIGRGLSSLEPSESVGPALSPGPLADLLDALHAEAATHFASAAPPPMAEACYCNGRRFLDLLLVFARLLSSRSRESREGSCRLESGLGTLERVQSDVAGFQSLLEEKHCVLQRQQSEANAALRDILAEQTEAEEKKRSSEALQSAIEAQDRVIAERRSSVEVELREVESSLVEAKRSVNSIQRSHLDEVRSMIRPPKNIQLTLEMVCLLLGEEESVREWKDIRRVLAAPDFIARVAGLGQERVTPAIAATLRRDYFSLPDFDFEAVNRSSKATGPLFLWIDSHLRYSEIVAKVQPLREEIASLEERQRQLHADREALESTIRTLAGVIDASRASYARLVQEVSETEREMASVAQRRDRAVSLLSSLSGEHERWRALLESMRAAQRTLVAEALLGAAFLTYGGALSLSGRRGLLASWRARLESVSSSSGKAALPADFDVAHSLSAPLERYEWHARGLEGEQAFQNAVVLKSVSRFALLLDPLGDGARFLQQVFPSMAVLSCLSRGHLVQLQAAVRAGGTVLLEHAEYLDSSLFALLSRDESVSGGQPAVSIGGAAAVPVHAGLRLFLHTTVSEEALPSFAFLASRVPVVNYSLSPASLQSHFVTEFIRLRSPELLERQVMLLRMELAQQTSLRELEDSLLGRLGGGQGSLLEDDSVLQTLASLKARASEVEAQLRETGQLKAALAQELARFEPIAKVVVRGHYLIASLSSLHVHYRESLSQYTAFVRGLASSAGLLAPEATAESALRALCLGLRRRQQPSMLPHDLICLQLRLTELVLEERAEREAAEGLAALLCLAQAPPTEQGRALASRVACFARLSFAAQEKLRSLLSERAFSGAGKAWLRFLNGSFEESACPEEIVPSPLPSSSSESSVRVACLRFVEVLRPDRLAFAAESLFRCVLGASEAEMRAPSLESVLRERPSNDPLLYWSSSVFSLETRLRLLSRTAGVPLASVSMGTQRSREQAQTLLAQAESSALCLSLVNIHLDQGFLSELERSLSSLRLHPSSLLFLCLPRECALPASSALPERCSLLVEGRSLSLKQRWLESATPLFELLGPPPSLPIAFLLVWVHSQIALRALYVPYGWSKDYGFTDSELQSSVECFYSLWGGDVSRFPWENLRATLEASVYGGKVTCERDRALLRSLLGHYLRPEALEPGFSLYHSSEATLLYPYSISSVAELLAWVEESPVSDDPAVVLGLAPECGQVYHRHQSARALASLERLQVEIPLSIFLQSASSSASEAAPRPILGAPSSTEASLSSLRDFLYRFVPSLRAFAPDVPPAVPACLSKEYSSLSGLLARLSSEFQAALARPSAPVVASLGRNAVPAAWLAVERALGAASEASVALSTWLRRSEQRFEHFEELLSALACGRPPAVSLSRLFHPEAFLQILRFQAAEDLG